LQPAATTAANMYGEKYTCEAFSLLSIQQEKLFTIQIPKQVTEAGT
jgi:hypothetical protein